MSVTVRIRSGEKTVSEILKSGVLGFTSVRVLPRLFHKLDIIANPSSIVKLPNNTVSFTAVRYDFIDFLSSLSEHTGEKIYVTLLNSDATIISTKIDGVAVEAVSIDDNVFCHELRSIWSSGERRLAAAYRRLEQIQIALVGHKKWSEEFEDLTTEHYTLHNSLGNLRKSNEEFITMYSDVDVNNPESVYEFWRAYLL